MSQEAFAAKIGVPPRTYQTLEQGKTTRITAEALAALSKMGVDLVDLVGGKRPADGSSPVPVSPTDLPPDKVNEYVLVPRYDVTASAGHGALVMDEHIIDWLAFKRSWIIGEMSLDPGKLSLITVHGDSMEPTLLSGDLVLVDTASRQVRGGGLYVVRMGEDLMAKRVVRLGPDEVRIVSDNKEWYPPITAKISDGVDIIGEIVWFCRALR